MPAQLPAQPAAVAPTSRETAVEVVIYLQATRARDFETAYSYVSAADRLVKDKNAYVRSQERFKGFVPDLDPAKRLAADMELWVIKQNPARRRFSLKSATDLPQPTKFLHGSSTGTATDSTPFQRLSNPLCSKRYQNSKKAKMITIEGRETFDLVRENAGWKILLDWQSRHKVLFKSSQPWAEDLAIKFLHNDLLAKSEEPFQVDFKVTNRTDREIVIKLDNLFEPRKMEHRIDMTACGSLVPFRLLAHETQELSSAYLLRGSLRPKGRLRSFMTLISCARRRRDSYSEKTQLVKPNL